MPAAQKKKRMTVAQINSHLSMLEKELTAMDHDDGYDFDEEEEKEEEEKEPETAADGDEDFFDEPAGEDDGGDGEDDGDDEKKKIEIKAKKGRKASGHDMGSHEAALTAMNIKLMNRLTMAEAKPYIRRMLTARAEAGMPEDQLAAFRSHMQKSTLSEIRQRFAEDRILWDNGASLTASDDTAEPAKKGGDSAGSLMASMPSTSPPKSQSLEDMFS